MSLFVLPDVSDIAYFTDPAKSAGRSSNDHNNKIREHILSAMPYIDDDYFNHPVYGESWRTHKTALETALREISPLYAFYKVVKKAGRGHNYDYKYKFYDSSQQQLSTEKVEFKYNALTLGDAPQFVSPMKPSQYLSQSFEEYYYDRYLVNLLTDFGLEVPERSLYLSDIHKTEPNCMLSAQQLYYEGSKGSSRWANSERAKAFYDACRKCSKTSISQFIQETDLRIDMLSDYLVKSQDKKVYLMYHQGVFRVNTVESSDYRIVNYIKQPRFARYVATIATGQTIKILLRWKNGNGIAFPAFQIS